MTICLSDDIFILITLNNISANDVLNYLKVATRTIRRYKGYSFINIAGLAMGMTIAGLISIWVFDELSFDRFNTNISSIHRVCVDLEAGTHMVLAMSMPELGEAATESFQEIFSKSTVKQIMSSPVFLQTFHPILTFVSK